MKKSILCYPFIQSKINQYPTGLYKIATFCKDEFEVIVLDQRIEQNINKKIHSLIENDEVICLGLSVMTGEQIAYALAISKEFHKKIPIVWGGIHPTISPKQVINHELIDYVIIGEGEEAFLNLLRYLYHNTVEKELFLSKTNNNYSNNHVNLDAIEYIDFDKYPIKKEYLVKRDGFCKAFPLETSRGCAHKCAFCHNSIIKKPYHPISCEKVADIIDDLTKRYSIDGIVFQEDNFFLSFSRVKEIINNLNRTDTPQWKANIRIDYLKRYIEDEVFMKKLIDSGCKVLQCGIESGSQRILDLINKRININDVREVNKKLSSYPINIRYNFIMGFPDEEKEDIDMTLEFISILCDQNPYAESPLVSVYTPYPGTPLFDRAVDLGFKKPNSLIEWSEINWRTASRNCWLTPNLQDFIESKSQEYAKKSMYTPYSKEQRI